MKAINISWIKLVYLNSYYDSQLQFLLQKIKIIQ